ncbi:MAG: hypothetical protein IPL93_12480 [Actinomycetales bacterium]|nr:hypothetical protein [Actinomycetales bacterium]
MWSVDLTVAKTAAGGFTRTYDWTIAKSASPAAQTIAAGQQATVDYGVTVTPERLHRLGAGAHRHHHADQRQ